MKIEKIEDLEGCSRFCLLIEGAIVAEAKVSHAHGYATISSFSMIDAKNLEWFLAEIKLDKKGGQQCAMGTHVFEATVSSKLSKVILSFDDEGLWIFIKRLAAMLAELRQGLNGHDHMTIEADGAGVLTQGPESDEWQSIEEIQINAWQKSALLK